MEAVNDRCFIPYGMRFEMMQDEQAATRPKQRPQPPKNASPRYAASGSVRARQVAKGLAGLGGTGSHPSPRGHRLQSETPVYTYARPYPVFDQALRDSSSRVVMPLDPPPPPPDSPLFTSAGDGGIWAPGVSSKVPRGQLGMPEWVRGVPVLCVSWEPEARNLWEELMQVPRFALKLSGGGGGGRRGVEGEGGVHPMACKLMCQPACLVSEERLEWEGAGIAGGDERMKLVITGDAASIPRSRDVPRI